MRQDLCAAWRQVYRLFHHKSVSLLSVYGLTRCLQHVGSKLLIISDPNCEKKEKRGEKMSLGPFVSQKALDSRNAIAGAG